MKLILLFVIVYYIGLVKAENTKDSYVKWCQEAVLDCPEDQRAYFALSQTDFIVENIGLSTRYLCLGQKTWKCVKYGQENTGEYNGCFPGNSTVSSIKGEVEMKDLKVGDWILDAHQKYTQVLGWLHRDPDATMEVVNINRQFRASRKHMVKMADGDFRFADRVGVGHKLGNGEIVKFLSVHRAQGVFAPFTQSGTILVDGVPASCYAHFPYHTASHWFVSAIYRLGLLATEDKLVPVSNIFSRLIKIVGH